MTDGDEDIGIVHRVKATAGLSVFKPLLDLSSKHLLLVPSKEPTLPKDVAIEESLCSSGVGMSLTWGVGTANGLNRIMSQIN